MPLVKKVFSANYDDYFPDVKNVLIMSNIFRVSLGRLEFFLVESI